MAPPAPADEQTRSEYHAIEELYHAYLTGMVLMAVTRKSAAEARELMFHLFRRQHMERFLPGLVKLGLDAEPDAVASAKYHYLSNHVGGVKVQYIPESDSKAWVRYLPPRWIFDGTAVCAIPTEVSRAMLVGWHGHNGVSLGNPRLGFVCTGQTMDGQPGLEGYYLEYDHDLEIGERVAFRPGEIGPRFDPDAVPRLDATSWPPARLAKASRNYSMEYIRNILPVMMELFGPVEARHVAHSTARLIGMQFYDKVVGQLGAVGSGAAGFAELMGRLAAGQGDTVVVEPGPGGSVMVHWSGWRLMRGLTDLPPEVFESWNGLFEGLAGVHDPDLVIEVTARLDRGDQFFSWRIGPRRSPTAF